MYRCLLFVAMMLCVGCGRAPEGEPAAQGEAPQPNEEPFVPPVPKEYKPIDPAVIKAWEELGYRVGWIDESTGEFSAQRERLKNPMPAFRLPDGDARFDKKGPRPAVGVPFGLYAYRSNINFRLELLRELLSSEHLTTFTLIDETLTAVDKAEAVLKIIAAAPNLTSVHMHGHYSKGRTHPIEIGFGGLRELTKLQRLTALSLTWTTLTDIDAHELTKFKNLTALNLSWNSGLPNSSMKVVAKLTSLRALDLKFTKITDSGLKELVSLKNLTSLNLSATKITTAGVTELAALRHLTSLDIGDTSVVNGDGFKALAMLERLDTLAVSNKKLTAADLKELAGLKRLTNLSFNRNDLTDADLKGLAGVTTLTALTVGSNPRITAEGWEALVPLKNLTTLNAAGTAKLQDADLKGITRLKSLRSLSLNAGEITGAGLKELATLKNLTFLELNLSFLELNEKKAGVEELRKALPNCKIVESR